MNRYPFRRLGAALLLASAAAGCSDAVGPDVTPPTDRTLYSPLPANPYSDAARLAMHAQMVALEGANRALAAGADRAGAYAAASDRANEFLAESGYPAGVRLDPAAAPAARAPRGLSAAQQRFVDAVLAETEALSPEVSPEAFDSRLTTIQAEATQELGETEAQVVLLAVATASAFWHQYHGAAQVTSVARALLPTGDPLFAKKKPKTFKWGEFGKAVVVGSVTTGLETALSVALMGGGPGGAATGLAVGMAVGAVGGGIYYALDTLL